MIESDFKGRGEAKSARERKARAREKKRGEKSRTARSFPYLEFELVRVLFRECHPPRRGDDEGDAFRVFIEKKRGRGRGETKRKRERERWQAREKTATTTPDRRSRPDLEASIPSIPSPLFLRSPHLACHLFWRIAVEGSRLGPCSWFEAASARQQDAKVLEDSGEEGKKKDSKGLVARLVSVAARRSSP